ncbi:MULTISPECIES: F0F1 ATP synthase subunit delta [Arthrobacter]|uniref:ATP synthase subunit delta n=1 Tax=Arthrobacter psychrochitiniphilus TaxID=291045 RepID=A0A2V3DPU0_9MICC|nr:MULTISPECIES: F0F1 ATP synthase subunit delta [Arthrobacter]NYG18229.1 F-type H+-transporting ATPase subunit delta [Arthrobacter psychrochitiniphilus]PXA64973.1 F0F1 ATP synthase subunit delta [Arthrobacter psychrochitiniphilus]
MAGVSSKSLAAALESLEPKLATASIALAQDLFAILGLLDSNAGLRRALTDPTRESADKAALATKLIAGKVSAEAQLVFLELVAARWSSARDLGDALETLAATSAIAVAEGQGGGSASLNALEEELFTFIRVVGSSHDLQRAFDDAQATGSAKSVLAQKVVPHASAVSALLIRQAVAAPRGLKPTALVQRFVELVAKRQQRWIAYVSVTRDLSAEQTARLQAGLNKLYGRDLKLNVNIDPTLVGGIKVVVGAEVVDATAATRLAELRRRLAV